MKAAAAAAADTSRAAPEPKQGCSFSPQDACGQESAPSDTESLAVPVYKSKPPFEEATNATTNIKHFPSADKGRESVANLFQTNTAVVNLFQTTQENNTRPHTPVYLDFCPLPPSTSPSSVLDLDPHILRTDPFLSACSFAPTEAGEIIDDGYVALLNNCFESSCSVTELLLVDKV